MSTVSLRAIYMEPWRLKTGDLFVVHGRVRSASFVKLRNDRVIVSPSTGRDTLEFSPYADLAVVAGGGGLYATEIARSSDRVSVQAEMVRPGDLWRGASIAHYGAVWTLRADVERTSDGWRVPLRLYGTLMHAAKHERDLNVGSQSRVPVIVPGVEGLQAYRKNPADWSRYSNPFGAGS